MKRQRVVKFVATVDVTREDWGYRVDYAPLKLIATAKTEAEAMDKMEKLISQGVDASLVHGNLKVASVGSLTK